MSTDNDPMPMRGDAWQAELELERSTRGLAALRMRVDIDHEPRRMGCKCGAQFGDSIDARCHLINQTIEAVIAAGWVSPEQAEALSDAWEEQANKVVSVLQDRAERAERERDVEREYGAAARESCERLLAALARVATLVEEFHGQALSASRDSEACDPGDPAQGAYWDGQADAWLEAESSIRDVLKEES